MKVALGTDAAVYPHGLNAGELGVYVKLGMTPLQALQSATLNAADLLGWKDKAGPLEPGKWADVIAVECDPTRDVTVLEHAKFVMKGGRVYKAAPRRRGRSGGHLAYEAMGTASWGRWAWRAFPEEWLHAERRPW